MSNRQADIVKFYDLLSRLSDVVDGPQRLSDPSSLDALPMRGVYFFFEVGERRSGTGEGSRVVRVGTQAISQGAKSTLGQRLKQHRGAISSGSGNHRGSVFRFMVGDALIRREGISSVHWGVGSNAPKEHLKNLRLSL